MSPWARPQPPPTQPKLRTPTCKKTQTLDLCFVLEGEITLVLDTEELQLEAGTSVVQRATNHAWSNRSDKPCVVAISSHDALPPA